MTPLFKELFALILVCRDRDTDDVFVADADVFSDQDLAGDNVLTSRFQFPGDRRMDRPSCAVRNLIQKGFVEVGGRRHHSSHRP